VLLIRLEPRHLAALLGAIHRVAVDTGAPRLFHSACQLVPIFERAGLLICYIRPARLLAQQLRMVSGAMYLKELSRMMFVGHYVAA